jgi:hypothetical protein
MLGAWGIIGLFSYFCICLKFIFKRWHINVNYRLDDSYWDSKLIHPNVSLVSFLKGKHLKLHKSKPELLIITPSWTSPFCSPPMSEHGNYISIHSSQKLQHHPWLFYSHPISSLPANPAPNLVQPPVFLPVTVASQAGSLFPLSPCSLFPM